MKRGIDVSSNNHPGGVGIGWNAVHQSGVTWVAVKLSEGAHYRNPWAVKDVHGAASVGLEVVGYHFARPHNSTPMAEAANLKGANANVGILHTLALDLEDGRQLGWKALAEWVHEFLHHCPVNIMYWNRTYEHGLHNVGAQFGLHQWIAEPTRKTMPADAAIWQYGQGPVPGIVGPVDLNQVR